MQTLAKQRVSENVMLSLLALLYRAVQAVQRHHGRAASISSVWHYLCDFYQIQYTPSTLVWVYCEVAEVLAHCAT